MLRFAPSPTGDMDINNLRIAIVNYILAQQYGESFTVRIDDTDKTRNIEGKDTEIMQILEKFALTHDSVFHQSEHLHMHQTLAIRLLEEKKAFVCTCTADQLKIDKENAKKNNTAYHYSGQCSNVDKKELSQLKENRTPFVIRIKKPEKNIAVHDLLKGNIHTAPLDVDSFIILHEDGSPSQIFAAACDDMLSGVSIIVQTDEHFTNASRLEHIKMTLGYDQETAYAHLPSIYYDQSEKLNANEDTLSLKSLLENGFIPDAIINYLLLLGNSKTPKEIFTLPEAIKWFNIQDTSQSALTFDMNKLRFINSEHLKSMDDKHLSTLFGFADEDIGKLAKLYLDYNKTTKELQEKITLIFTPKNFECQWGEKMRILTKVIQNAPMINDYDTFKSHIVLKSGLSEENILKPLRILLTGAEDGPELSKIYPLIKSYILEVAS
jgi:glutamyl-tRNA synthetase